MLKLYHTIFVLFIVTVNPIMSKASILIKDTIEDRGHIKKQAIDGIYFKKSFNDLPHDIIEYIFLCSQKKDIPSIQRTCKLWHEINNHRKLWHKYLIKGYLIDPLKAYDNKQDYKNLFKFYATYSFTILEQLNATSYSKACAVSSNGKIIVGNIINAVTDNRKQACIWQYDDLQMIPLGTLNHGKYSKACAMNPDGTIIIGTAHDGITNLEDTAFIWKQNTQYMQSLGHIKNTHYSKAWDLNADGTTVVGCVRDHKTIAFIWHPPMNINQLTDLSQYEYSECRGVSADGNVIIGYFLNNSIHSLGQSFMWKQDISQLCLLGTLNNGRYSHAFAINAAETIVVGVAADGNNNNQDTAFIWRQDKPQLHSLGNLNNGYYSKATGISSDGMTVIGMARDGLNNNEKCPFIWRQETNMQSFSQLLKNQKLLPKDHIIKRIKAINFNGTVLVGDGIYQDQVYAWHAVIPKTSYF